MTRVNAMRPLIGRQMRMLKWFLIGFLVVCGFVLFMLAGDLAGAEDSVWTDSATDLNRWDMPLNIIGNHTLGAFWALGVLALLMAVAQQIDALNPRSAQLLGAMPVTRGKCLMAQLLPGLGVIAITAVLYGIGACALLAQHRQMLDLGARISGVSQVMLMQNTMLLPIAAALRLLVLMTSVYLITTAVMGLFGNAAFGAGFLAALLLLAYAYLVFSYEIGHQVYAAMGVARDYDHATGYRTLLLTLLGPGCTSYQSMWPGDPWPVMPWDNLLWFLLIHAAMWGISLLVLRAERGRMAIENLGNPMLYAGTRWIVVLYGVLWAMLIPLLNLTVYSSKLQHDVANPWLPLMFVPVLLVLVIGWCLLIERPRRRVRLNRAATALALVLALLISPAARAEDHPAKIKDEFDASQIAYSDAQAERVTRLTDALKRRMDDRHSEHEPDEGFDKLMDEYGYDNSYSSSLHDGIRWSDGQQLMRDYSNYLDAVGAFQDCALEFRLAESLEDADSNALVTDAELAEDLRSEGYEALADGCTGAEDMLLQEDGLWLRIRSVYAEEDGQPVFQYRCVELYADSPFSVVGAEAIDAAVMAVPGIRRTAAFANGGYQTLSYALMMEDWEIWRGQPVVQVILKEAEPYKLLLSAPLNYAETRQAMERAKSALVAVEKAAGAQGNWRESRDPVFSKQSRIMVSFG